MKLTPLIALVLCAVVGAGTWLLRSQGGRGSRGVARVPTAQDSGSRLDEELGHIRGELRRLKNQQGALHGELGMLRTEAGAGVAREEQTNEQSSNAAPARLEDDDLLEHLARRMRFEKEDPHFRDWARRGIDALKLRPELAGSHAVGLECRASLCKLEMRYDAVQDRERFLDAAGSLEVFSGELFVRAIDKGEGERPAAVIYFAGADSRLVPE